VQEQVGIRLERLFAAHSGCWATRLLVCFVLSRIGSPFQVNLYHQYVPLRLVVNRHHLPPFSACLLPLPFGRSPIVPHSLNCSLYGKLAMPCTLRPHQSCSAQWITSAHWSELRAVPNESDFGLKKAWAAGLAEQGVLHQNRRRT